jgi:flagellar biosynthesis GTPase FlhF
MATNEAIDAARELAAAEARVTAEIEAQRIARERAAQQAREDAERKREEEALERELAKLKTEREREVARVTAEYQRLLNEQTRQSIEEQNAEVAAALARREALFTTHFERVSSISQSFGANLVNEQGKIGQALLETGRQALAAETGQLAKEFALRAAAYALVGNLPQAAAYTAGAAALGVTSGVLQAGGIRALNGTGSRRGDRSGRR